jgi:hypothetical protein
VNAQSLELPTVRQRPWAIAYGLADAALKQPS